MYTQTTNLDYIRTHFAIHCVNYTLIWFSFIPGTVPVEDVFLVKIATEWEKERSECIDPKIMRDTEEKVGQRKDRV